MHKTLRHSTGTVCAMHVASRSARQSLRRLGDAWRATRLERGVVLLLVPAGVALGHVGAYQLVYRDHGVRHAALADHHYFQSFAVAAAVCGVVALLRAVGGERGRRTGRLPVGVLTVTQMAVFAALEVGERLLAGRGLPSAVSEPAVWVGLAVQVGVAGLLAAAVRWLAPLLAGLVPSAPALRALPSGFAPPRCTATSRRGGRPGLSPCTLRGPPLAAA